MQKLKAKKMYQYHQVDSLQIQQAKQKKIM